MRTGFITAMVAAAVVSACSPYDLAPGDTDLGLSDRSSLARVDYQYHVGDQPAGDGMGPVVMTLRPADRDCAEARRWAYRYPADHFTAYGYAIRDGVGRANGWCPPLTAMRPLPPPAAPPTAEQAFAMRAAEAARGDARILAERLFELDDLRQRGVIDADYHARRRAELLDQR